MPDDTWLESHQRMRAQEQAYDQAHAQDSSSEDSDDEDCAGGECYGRVGSSHRQRHHGGRDRGRVRDRYDDTRSEAASHTGFSQRRYPSPPPPYRSHATSTRSASRHALTERHLHQQEQEHAQAPRGRFEYASTVGTGTSRSGFSRVGSSYSGVSRANTMSARSGHDRHDRHRDADTATSYSGFSRGRRNSFSTQRTGWDESDNETIRPSRRAHSGRVAGPGHGSSALMRGERAVPCVVM